MREKVVAYIRKYHMLEQGGRVVAGVSGGADSVCLLHLLVSLARQFGLKILAVHVHHGLRGEEADRDMEFVRELSKKWEVPCLAVCRDAGAYAREHGLSVEEAGREIRYQAFYEAAEKMGGARIAVAHHQEDQAETILHNLFRGSGLKGMGGMSPVRGDVIRPLLCVGRREIMDYLKEYGISYCQDSTNNSAEYTRNKLRHRVLPMVCEEINAGAVAHIVAAGERMRQAEAYFEKEAARLLQEYGKWEGGNEGRYRRVGIPAGTMADFPDILRGYVVMEMIGELSKSRKDISSVHVEQILDLIGKRTGREFALPYGLRAYKEYDMLWVKTGERERKEQAKMLLNHPSFSTECFPVSVLREKYQKIPEKKYTKWFDYDRIIQCLEIRTRRPGDYLEINREHGRKKLKNFLIDQKVPARERERIWLLADGSHILWIPGMRISEAYKITEHTTRILKVQLCGGNEDG